MRRQAAILGAIALGLAGMVVQPAHAVVTPPLVQILDLSIPWDPTPAPDPMGLAYDSAKDRLLIPDSEVEEPVAGNPPAYWQGVNFFEATRLGVLTRSVNISKKNLDLTPNPLGYTDEPADVAYNAGHYYIIDDQQSEVWDVVLGDGNFDATDLKTSFRTHDMTLDTEGLGFGMIGGRPNLFIAAGEGPEGNSSGIKVHEIWRIDPGPNLRFDGPPGPANNPAGDDVATHFDTCRNDNVVFSLPDNPCTNPINQHDPEDVAYDSLTGHLFFGSRQASGGRTIISETTLDGILVDTYDLGSISGLRPSGIVVAPASGNPSARSIYLASRGVDNNSNPLANDGKIYEWQLEGPVNHAPVVVNPGSKTSNEGTTVSLPITATDVDGDAIVSYGATNLPSGLSINTTTGLISGTIPYGAWAGSPKSVTVSATDSTGLTGTAQFTWTILRDLTPPAMPGAVTAVRLTSGLSLDWPDNTETDLAGYKVSRSATANGTFTDLTPTPRSASDFFDADAPPGATSYYRVTAIDRAVPTPNVSPPRTANARRGKIALVGSSKAAGSGMTFAIPKPGTPSRPLAPGDVLLAAVSVRGSAAIVPPQGWTLVSLVSRTVSMSHQAIYSHTVGSVEPAVYAFTFLGRASAVGTIVAYRGALERPSKVAAQANPASSLITAPSVTPTAAESVQVGIFGISSDAVITSPSGMWDQQQIMLGAPPGNAIELADAVVDPVPISARVATASAAAENIGQVLVLSPSP